MVLRDLQTWLASPSLQPSEKGFFRPTSQKTKHSKVRCPKPNNWKAAVRMSTHIVWFQSLFLIFSFNLFTGRGRGDACVFHSTRVVTASQLVCCLVTRVQLRDPQGKKRKTKVHSFNCYLLLFRSCLWLKG